MPVRPFRSLPVLSLAVLLFPVFAIADELRERLKDENGVQTDWWVYNDIPAAMAEARRSGKPVFVTFRCVPCRDCAAFDADVANGNERIRDFAQKHFVSVRQVEMKGVDLSQFQFDYDLNWAALFLNADGTVYARYGTQSAEGSDAWNSIDGLLNTMQQVLKLHAAWPANQTELQGKRGPAKEVRNALEMPGLSNPEKYAQQTTRGNCIHCHNIHDAEHRQAVMAGQWTPELMWKYPLPENIGLRIDRTTGTTITGILADSPAAGSGLVAGRTVLRMNGQRITSIADMQWVLHHLPGTATDVRIETLSGGEDGNTDTHTLQLPPGWRKQDFSWRGSMWNAPPRLQVWLPELSREQSEALGLPAGDQALEARWINRESRGGQQAWDDGLREKDIVIALDGKPIRMTSPGFQAFIKMKYRIGDHLPLTILRDGIRQERRIQLVE